MMAKIRGGGNKTAVDPNIKFPLSDKPQPWVETVEEAKHARWEEDEQETNGHAEPHSYCE